MNDKQSVIFLLLVYLVFLSSLLACQSVYVIAAAAAAAAADVANLTYLLFTFHPTMAHSICSPFAPQNFACIFFSLACLHFRPFLLSSTWYNDRPSPLPAVSDENDNDLAKTTDMHVIHPHKIYNPVPTLRSTTYPSLLSSLPARA